MKRRGGRIRSGFRIFKEVGAAFLLLAVSAVFLWPVSMALTGAFRAKWELMEEIGGIFGVGEAYASWSLLPISPVFSHMWKLLTKTPDFFVMFWNSVRLTVGILMGQMLLTVPAGWALAAYDFPGRKAISWMYLVLMLMPFQVRMLPDYILLDRLHLLNTHAGILLPAVFSAFPVFILSHAFSGISPQILEAARIDGAGEWRIFLDIALPLGRSGILSAGLLSFIECWNMVEQPMTFLKTRTLWPLSLFAGDVAPEHVGEAFSAAILMLLPCLLLFAGGSDILEQGISAAIKD